MNSIKQVGQLLLQWLGISFAYLLGSSVIGWQLLRRWPGDQFLPVRLMTYFAPWLLLLVGITLFISMILRRARLGLLLGIAMLILGNNLWPIALPQTTPVTVDGPSLKIMSHNVFHGDRDITPLVRLIEEENPDILLLQELHRPLAEKLFEALNNIHDKETLHNSYWADGEQAIISRYPLTELGVRLEAGVLQKVRVDTPYGTIQVWNVHPVTPLRWETHQYQYDFLAEELQTVDGAFILGGDFNTTYGSEAYHKIAHRLHNAHLDQGQGFVFTYPIGGIYWGEWHAPIPPMVRIDHILFSDEFMVKQANTLTKAAGSNHRPIVAELLFN